MKRKRGQKKGKPKKASAVDRNEAISNVVSTNLEDNSGLDDVDCDGLDSRVEAETQSPLSDQPDKYASITSDGLIEKPVEKATYGRVKVKLKTSKTLEAHTSSDAPAQSDTDKSSLQVGVEKQGLVTEKMEDSANSLSSLKTAAPGNSPIKASSIKFKSSKGLVSSSINATNSNLGQGGSTYAKEIRSTHENPCYNKAELSDALTVIKKVMKMEAAEPFNVPVNPVELGIPDYFDVIDTPMDFGTICSNLESGTKYMNSEDVYKDVQCIWDNCYKYNNKGDYILELMKRVKKNFAKYWTAAGLYDEQSRPDTGVQSIQVEDDNHAAQGKVHTKGGHSKHKGRKRHGFKRHKDSCLCAICIMRRRRQEREENARMIEDQTQTTSGDDNLAKNYKQEVMSNEESPNEDISSNMGNSLDPDTDADLEEKGEVMKVNGGKQDYNSKEEKQEKEKNQMVIEVRDDALTTKQSHLVERTEKHSMESQEQMPEDLDVNFQTKMAKEETSVHQEKEAASVLQKHKESLDKHKKARALEEFLRYENPMLMEICGKLFPDNPKSVWHGPHSLVQHVAPHNRSSSIHAAIASFMK